MLLIFGCDFITTEDGNLEFPRVCPRPKIEKYGQDN